MSKYIINRHYNKITWNATKAGGKCFVVNYYKAEDKSGYYGRAVWAGPRKKWAARISRSPVNKEVRYRIIVTPKSLTRC